MEKQFAAVAILLLTLLYSHQAKSAGTGKSAEPIDRTASSCT
jgi:hypothetical protein